MEKGKWVPLDDRFLPVVEEKLKKIREMPEDNRYEAIIDLISPIELSASERLKLRNRLKREFDFPVRDFDQAFNCKFHELMYESFGRGTLVKEA
jgi:hypothetical protein